MPKPMIVGMNLPGSQRTARCRAGRAGQGRCRRAIGLRWVWSALLLPLLRVRGHVGAAQAVQVGVGAARRISVDTGGRAK